MTDRYTKIVLTIIAGALIYICAVITPLPAVSAQQQASKRPGESTGPAEVVIVGWKQTAPMEISTEQPLRVITERSSGVADRVVLVGWEENALKERASAMRVINRQNPGLPVSMR